MRKTVWLAAALALGCGLGAPSPAAGQVATFRPVVTPPPIAPTAELEKVQGVDPLRLAPLRPWAGPDPAFQRSGDRPTFAGDFAERFGTRKMPATGPFGPGCTLPCPPGANVETEPCGGEENDGCSMGYCGVGGFIDINAGDIWCGNVYADQGVRDLDYYRITTTGVTTIEITVTSEFPSLFALAEDPTADCGSLLITETGNTDSCTPLTISRTVVAGTYYLLIGAGDVAGPIFDGIACGTTENDYTVEFQLLSADLCGACPGSSELEACGDDTNGGCAGVPEAIASGDTVCGTTRTFIDPLTGGAARDVDFYEITVAGPDPAEITVDVSSEFPALFGVSDNLCPDLTVFTTGTSPGGCVAGSASIVLGPGTYWVFVGAGDEFGPLFTGIDCTDPANEYQLTVTTATAPPGCALTCPAGSITEAEACGDDTNGGCNSTPSVFETIDFDSTVCGTVWANGGTRDTDWYQVTAFDDVELTMDLTAQGSVSALLLNADCGALFIVAEVHSDACATGTTTLNLATGAYYLWVGTADASGTAIFDGFPCGFSNDYVLTTTTAPVGTGGCTVSCPAGATQEIEACGGDDNDLCFAAGVPGLAEDVGTDPDLTICGTLIADGNRDFDFYSFTLSAPTAVDVELTSNLPASVSIVTDVGACPAFVIDEEDLSISTGDCTPVPNTSAILPPGDYLLLLTTGGLLTGPVFAGFPCGTQNDYTLSVTAAATAGCFGPDGLVMADCVTSLLELDLTAQSCYDDLAYDVTDEAGTSVLTGTLAGPFSAGDAILENLGPLADPGVYTVTITSNCCNGDTDVVAATVGLFPYSGETDVVVAAELDGGCVDSATALKDALEANGRSVLVTTFIEGYECAVDFDENTTVWVVHGTFPNSTAMTAQEGLDLVGLLTNQGVSIYLEGGDIWGFDAPTTYFEYDGVAGREIDGNVMIDGDDTFTLMSGVALPDLDTSVFGDVVYNQDSRNPLLPDPALGGIDWTDQLVPSGPASGFLEDEPAGSTSEAIWFNVDDGIPGGGPEDLYATTIFTIPSEPTFGRVMSSSWEFGGFDGNQTDLMAAYLGAMQEAPAGPLFRRGDANGDGGFDISDAVYTLSALFVPGSPPAACQDAADANNDNGVDISDAVYTLSALFVPGSPPPPAPHPDCGVDSVDPTTCDDYPGC